jgi:hypothetical protein
MTVKNNLALKASAVSLAVVGMLLASSTQAGVIADSNPTVGAVFKGECGTAGAAQACVGAWNLDNVDVQQVRTADGSVFSTFDSVAKTTGVYAAMTVGDSFVSSIKDTIGTIMAKLTGKDWPVGEPTGIKAVNGDTQTKNGKPQNCLINSSYLGADVSTSGSDAYLDSANPEPVICSSGFQSHKRFKIAMQPGAVDGVADGAISDKPIDMVFNVADGGGLTSYQVFSKINNYTGKRLKGYRIVVGRGVGTDPTTGFKSASDLGIAEKLHISLGKSEASASGAGGLPNGLDLFDGDGLATFSHGLFGAVDTNFTSNGFFDTRTAGFDVEQTCSTASGTVVACPPGYTGPDGVATLMNSDTIQSTTVLPSNYTGPAAAPLTAPLFGDWLPSKWQPSGVFYDDDNNPSTDPVLKAWWNGSQWVGNNDGGFTPIPAATLEAWGKDPLYEVSKIEDVLNLGINYIVKVGDGIGSNFTIRIIPVVADTQVEPTFLATAAAPLAAPVAPVASGGGGGGCTTAVGNVPFDPMLPMLAALGLVGLGVRRLRRH